MCYEKSIVCIQVELQVSLAYLLNDFQNMVANTSRVAGGPQSFRKALVERGEGSSWMVVSDKVLCKRVSRLLGIL